MLIVSVVIGTFAAFVVALFRGRQLERWDLRNSLVAPSTAAILWTVALSAVIPAALMSLSVYTAEPCAPAQKTANVLYLWAGALVGVAVCLFGLAIANRRYARGSRR
ncbi:MAG: hypothetical protein OXH75_12400 [Acidobacteria bacterium]|nr:hypothetical protein [Acidobacteriota bacterium]